MTAQSILCQLPRSSISVGNRISSGNFRRPLANGRPSFHPTLLCENRQLRRIIVSAFNEENQATSAKKEESGSNEYPPFLAIAVTEDSWKNEVIESSVPVFVDFWAPWCGPCKMIGPTIDELIKELGESFKAVKLNTDDNPGVATEYGIRSIPTCMVFKKGKKVESVIGAVGKSILKTAIEKHLS